MLCPGYRLYHDSHTTAFSLPGLLPRMQLSSLSTPTRFASLEWIAGIHLADAWLVSGFNCTCMTADGKATVWVIGSNEGGDYTLNAYDGETGALLYQVGPITAILLPPCYPCPTLNCRYFSALIVWLPPEEKLCQCRTMSPSALLYTPACLIPSIDPCSSGAEQNGGGGGGWGGGGATAATAVVTCLAIGVFHSWSTISCRRPP